MKCNQYRKISSPVSLCSINAPSQQPLTVSEELDCVHRRQKHTDGAAAHREVKNTAHSVSR